MGSQKNHSGRVFWIVWNEAKNEGVVFDNKLDAEWTAGRPVRLTSEPSIGGQFRLLYDDDEMIVESVTLRPAEKQS